MDEVVDPDLFSLAYDQAADAGLVRARYEFDTGWDPADWSAVVERLPSWIRVAGRVVKPLVQRKLGDIDFARDAEEGVIDLAGRRSAMCPTHRPWVVVIGDRQWYGTPGELLDEKDSFTADTTHPLWLLSLLKGIVEATPAEPVIVRGEECRAFAATADLARASAATPGGLFVCEVRRVEDLSALPLHVALDEQGRVRRITGDSTYGSTGNNNYMVELWDYGRVTAIDWTRVPALDRPTA